MAPERRPQVVLPRVRGVVPDTQDGIRQGDQGRRTNAAEPLQSPVTGIAPSGASAAGARRARAWRGANPRRREAKRCAPLRWRPSIPTGCNRPVTARHRDASRRGWAVDEPLQTEALAQVAPPDRPAEAHRGPAECDRSDRGPAQARDVDARRRVHPVGPRVRGCAPAQPGALRRASPSTRDRSSRPVRGAQRRA